MLSHRSFTEIIRITDEVLHQIGTRQAIDRITVIHLSMQLLSRRTDLADHHVARLINALDELLLLARKTEKRELTAELEALLATINEER